MAAATVPLLILNLLLYTLSSYANLVSFIIFRVSAFLIVILIQSLKIPGAAVDTLLDYIASIIRTCSEILLENTKDVVLSLASKSIDVITGTVSESLSFTESAAMQIVENTKDAIDALGEMFPDALWSTSEIAGKILASIWKNYMGALAYIKDNA